MTDRQYLEIKEEIVNIKDKICDSNDIYSQYDKRLWILENTIKNTLESINNKLENISTGNNVNCVKQDNRITKLEEDIKAFKNYKILVIGAIITTIVTIIKSLLQVN